MMLLRLLNPQGIAGLAASIAMAILLVVQKGETRHWRKQGMQFEQLYAGEQAALAGTIANYRAAAETARATDAANAERVKAEQFAINERTGNDFQARIAAARAAARGLLPQPQAAADPGTRRAAPVPGLPAAPRGAAETASKDGLSQGDALTATEQAIQLDELIKWVREQQAVNPNVAPANAGASGRECAERPCSANR